MDHSPSMDHFIHGDLSQLSSQCLYGVHIRNHDLFIPLFSKLIKKLCLDYRLQRNKRCFKFTNLELSLKDSIFSCDPRQGRKPQLVLRINIHGIKMNSNFFPMEMIQLSSFDVTRFISGKGLKVKGSEQSTVPLYLLPPTILNRWNLVITSEKRQWSPKWRFKSCRVLNWAQERIRAHERIKSQKENLLEKG